MGMFGARFAVLVRRARVLPSPGNPWTVQVHSRCLEVRVPHVCELHVCGGQKVKLPVHVDAWCTCAREHNIFYNLYLIIFKFIITWITYISHL